MFMRRQTRRPFSTRSRALTRSRANGKPVLVTGASKGIGRAIALRLGGCKIFGDGALWPRRAGAAAESLPISEAQAATPISSVSISRGARSSRGAEAAEKGGAYWGVVTNAGIARDNAFPAIDGDDWDAVLHTNLDGFYNVLHPLVMPMISRRDGGRIVTMSSVSGLIGNRGQVNYSASKAGIIGATKALAIELAKRNITVNCIAPGIIETAMTRRPCRKRRSSRAHPHAPLRQAGRSRRPRGIPVLRRCRLHHPPGHLGEWRALLMRRVVVTGMGGLTALGGTWPEIRARMEAGQTGTRYMHGMGAPVDLNTKIGSAIDWFDHTTTYPSQNSAFDGTRRGHGA